MRSHRWVQPNTYGYTVRIQCGFHPNICSHSKECSSIRVKFSLDLYTQVEFPSNLYHFLSFAYPRSVYQKHAISYDSLCVTLNLHPTICIQKGIYVYRIDMSVYTFKYITRESHDGRERTCVCMFSSPFTLS
jgi:hypothetical protein